MSKALLIVDHGSRSPEPAEELNRIATLVAEETDAFEVVRTGHMEFATPSIPEAISALVNEGIQEIVVMPYFLSVGVHMKRDIPEILDEARKAHPDITITIKEHLGVDSLMAQMVIKRALG